MTTVTLQYDARSSLMKQLLDVFLTAGAKLVEPKAKVSSKKDETLEGYQKLFGKREGNQYTDNEIFVYNSQRHIAPILEKYAD